MYSPKKTRTRTGECYGGAGRSLVEVSFSEDCIHQANLSKIWLPVVRIFCSTDVQQFVVVVVVVVMPPFDIRVAAFQHQTDGASRIQPPLTPPAHSHLRIIHPDPLIALVCSDGAIGDSH